MLVWFCLPFVCLFASATAQKTAIDCGVVPDGLYPHPTKECWPKYFWCFGGQIGQETCPGANEAFDPKSKTCKDKAVIDSCPPAPETTVETTRRTTRPTTRLTTTTKRTTTTEPSDVCEERPDGDYASKRGQCSAEFVACAEGLSYQMVCPGTTFFDENSASCQYAQYVKACGGRPTQKAPTTPGTTVALPDISLNCGSLKDGYYENPLEGCSRFYIACADGVSHIMYCATDNLRFDVITNECLEPRYVEWCGGNPTTRRPQTTKAPVDFHCGGQLDGFYPNPVSLCSAVYYSCSGGYADRMYCAVGMMFDQQSRRCLEPAYIRACGGSPTLIPITTTHRVIIDAGAVNCYGKLDGDYPNQQQPCSSTFFSCTNYQVATKYCNPPSLRFDMQTNKCLEPAYVAACGGQPTDAPTTTTTEFTPIVFDCRNKLSGFYADPEQSCNRVYYACVGGIAQRLSCPANLRFDPETGDCLHRIYVKVCGGTPTTRAPSTTHTIPDIKPTPTIFNCQNRPDGQYEDIRNPCSSFYFICQAGQTFQKRCKGNKKWDVLDRSCKHQWQVEWCK